MITAAADLLRESGPTALTSVNVAKRLGVTQSAIYRHVNDMDELATMAGQRVVGDLSAMLTNALDSPNTTANADVDLPRLATRIVAVVAEHDQAVTTIDRWRHEPGGLGDGIRAILDAGAEMTAGILERSWRSDFDCDDPFDETTRAVQLAHARLVVDDAIACAREVPGAGATNASALARTLRFRLFAGWCGYVLEMNTRMGIPIPELGGPSLSLSEFSLS